MKTYNKYIALAAMALTFAACTQEEDFTPQTDGDAVKINATIAAMQTRVAYEDDGATIFINGDEICVQNILRETKNIATYTFDGTTWTTTDALVWNGGTAESQFQAWYPATASFDEFTLPTDQNSIEELPAADWMTASTSAMVKPDDKTINLAFEHKLAKVTVQITEFTSQFGDDPRLMAATIYSLSDEYVTVNGGIRPVLGGNAATAIVCPGTYTAGTDLMEVTISDDGRQTFLNVPVNAFLTNTGLVAGKHYKFSLKVGKDVISITKVNVEPWTTKDIDGGVAEEVVNLNIINATVMSTDELNAAVTRALTAGYTDIKVTLAPDAGEDMFQAIAAPIAATVDPSLESWELVGIGTIDLTISGAKTVPEYVFYGVDYGYTEHWAAGPVLRSVTLPDVTEIKNSAFCSCINLISVSAPKCEVIGTNAFLYDESISSIYFPVAKIIGDGAFGWCESLTEISLPEATTLGNSALGICSNLKTAYLPKVTHINGHDAFYDCKSLVKITLGAIATVNDSNIGTFKDTPTENIDLVLSPEQKAMTYDSSTKIYTAGTEAFDFGNTNEFVGYTFKSITFVGE